MIGDIIILQDGCGRRRTHVYVCCEYCTTIFPKPKRFVSPGKRNFCKRSCQSEFNKNRIVAKCAVCGKIVERRARLNKSGLVFCCQDHKNMAQSHKYNRVLKCGPITATSNYRALALAEYGEKCAWCNETIKKLLDTHHIDHNRANGDLSNLIMLCIRCHALETRGLVVIKDRMPVAVGAIPLDKLLILECDMAR